LLRDAGLVTSERRGAWIFYSLAPETLTEAAGMCATLGFKG